MQSQVERVIFVFSQPKIQRVKELPMEMFQMSFMWWCVSLIAQLIQNSKITSRFKYLEQDLRNYRQEEIWRKSQKDWWFKKCRKVPKKSNVIYKVQKYVNCQYHAIHYYGFPTIEKNTNNLDKILIDLFITKITI